GRRHRQGPQHAPRAAGQGFHFQKTAGIKKGSPRHLNLEVIPFMRPFWTKLFMAGLLWGAFFLIPGAPALSQPESLNSQTDNLNVLFLGFEDEELAMVAVYSIN